MDVLARTAAGTLSGKAKIDLETYVQTTYFDHILSRANLRLQKMSGGQYDLKRRRNADSKQSRSGLDLDIVDHINAASIRSPAARRFWHRFRWRWVFPTRCRCPRVFISTRSL